MREIRVTGDCDRAMLVPQPARWASNADEAIHCLLSEKWDNSAFGKGFRRRNRNLSKRQPAALPAPVIVLSWGT
jgi:hypothetical protein